MKYNQIRKKIGNYKYHRTHKKEALLAVKNIEDDTNYKLSTEQRKMIKDYAKERLGSTVYAYWLYVYTAYNQGFKEGWIPDNYFGKVVTPVVNNQIGIIASMKTLTNKLIQTPLLPDKIYKINHTFYDREFNTIDEKDIENILFSDSKKEYFLKTDRSNSGRGVTKIDSENYNLDLLLNSDNFVIQSAIIQNEFFNEIVAGSVATLRITTVKVKDKVETRATYLRVGREKTPYLQAVSNLRVPIINKKGELGDFSLDPDWKRVYKHPDTNFIFKGKKIPYFEKAISAMEKIHEKFPHYTIIGWDVSINENGDPQIIEWNADHPDIKYTESVIGPSFKDLNWESLNGK